MDGRSRGARSGSSTRSAIFRLRLRSCNRLVPEAEAADHHPDIIINYRRVTLLYSTHSEGGLTQKDFDGAAMADRKVR